MADELNRSQYDITDRLKVLTKQQSGQYNFGKWSDKEVERLYHAVSVVSEKSESRPEDGDFGWEAVSEIVKTRGLSDCVRRWKVDQGREILKNYHAQDGSQKRSELAAEKGFGIMWDNSLRSELIKRLRASPAKRYEDIDWDQILSDGWCPFDKERCKSWINSQLRGPGKAKLLSMPLQKVVDYLLEKVEYHYQRLLEHGIDAETAKLYGSYNSLSEEELEALIEAVTVIFTGRTVEGCSEGSYNPWKKISNMVQTRTHRQCCNKWISWLYTGYHPKLGKLSWGYDQEMELVNQIRNSKAETAESIDWKAIASPNWTMFTAELCKEHWERRVERHPRASEMPLKEQLDWLEDQISNT